MARAELGITRWDIHVVAAPAPDRRVYIGLVGYSDGVPILRVNRVERRNSADVRKLAAIIGSMTQSVSPLVGRLIDLFWTRDS